MVKPILPKEVVVQKESIIPDYVIEAFNYLIAANFSGGSSIVKQQQVEDLIIQKASEKGIGITRGKIMSEHWLDIEELYQQGPDSWSVKYDRPAIDENYEPFFTFKPKRKRKS